MEARSSSSLFFSRNGVLQVFDDVHDNRRESAFAVHAVKLNDSGDGLRLLQEHLGHQSITTTMKYRKVSGEEQREWYKQLWNGGKQDG